MFSYGFRINSVFFTDFGIGILREDELKPMDAEQLREYGHKMEDFIADYYKNIESFPVLSQVQVLLSNSSLFLR